MANRVYSGIVELYDYEINKNAWNYKGRLLTDLQQAPTTMTTTRTENPYVSATSFNRIVARKIGPNLLWVSFNVTIDNTSLPRTTDFVVIGKINGISSVVSGIFHNIPAQNGSGTICLTFQDTGTLRIWNEASQGAVSGFVRTSFVAVVDFA